MTVVHADKYRKLFLDESRRHLQAVEDRMLAEGDLSRSHLDEVFREIHSLKGMASTMGFAAMSGLAHRLEDVLDRWRSAGGLPGARARDVVLRVCDRLGEMRDDIASGSSGDLDWQDLDAALGEASDAPASRASLEDAVHVRLHLDPDCGSPAARAYLCLLRYRELDPDVESDPDEGRLLSGDAGQTLDLYLHGVDRAGIEAVYAGLTEVRALTFPDDEDAGGVPSPPGPPDEPELEPVRAESSGAAGKVRLPESVQAPVGLLDEFVDLLGELTITRSNIEETARVLGSELLLDEVDRLGKLVRTLHERVMGLRMLPFSLITGGLRRLVRDHARELGKEVELRVSGEEIGMDKSILLEVSDPLVHLLRNALDHGLEPPDERRRKGKLQQGSIELRAARTRNRVEVTVRDDGRGIDAESVRRRAVELGLFKEDESRRLGPSEIFACLFRPGFTTRTEASSLSGRGVGMDVVKSKVESLGGAIELVSAPGEGTEVRLSLPLSVAIVPVLLVAVGESVLAFPTPAVVRTVEAQPRDVRKKEDGHVLLTEEGQVPILSLGQVLRLQGRRRFERMPLVVTQTPRGPTALAVDAFLREEDLFIKPLRGPLQALRGLSGYSVLGDGRLVFLLDPPSLFGP